MTESNGPDSVLDVRTLCFISPSRPFSSLHSQIPPPRSRGECPLSQPALDFSVKEWGEKMLLGKRPRARPPMARTTSMTKLTFDLSEVQAPAPSDPQSPVGNLQRQNAGPGGLDGLDRRLLSTVSPRHQRRNSGDFVETAHFLRACGLCKRRLVRGRDIYMYRGDSAFCSLECRQQQMNQDERKEKCSLASKKEGAPSTTTSEASSKGETLAAA